MKDAFEQFRLLVQEAYLKCKDCGKQRKLMKGPNYNYLYCSNCRCSEVLDNK